MVMSYVWHGFIGFFILECNFTVSRGKHEYSPILIFSTFSSYNFTQYLQVILNKFDIRNLYIAIFI